MTERITNNCTGGGAKQFNTLLPEPKPYYGIEPAFWEHMNDEQRKEAKQSYCESAALLRSIYAELLAPIAVVKKEARNG